MYYYLARLEPAAQDHPAGNGHVSLTYEQVCSWDATWIHACGTGEVVDDLLYNLWDTSDQLFNTVYIERTDALTYDLMLAFGIPQFDLDRLMVVIDQEIYHREIDMRRVVRWYDAHRHPTVENIKISGKLRGIVSQSIFTGNHMGKNTTRKKVTQ